MRADRVVSGAPHGLPADARVAPVQPDRLDHGCDQRDDAYDRQQQDENSGRGQPRPAGVRRQRAKQPAGLTQATTLITVVQTQPRRRCNSRTVAATSGSESVTADSGDPTRQG
jgi:hypothetical protein